MYLNNKINEFILKLEHYEKLTNKSIGSINNSLNA
jgi:hypothetical protein